MTWAVSPPAWFCQVFSWTNSLKWNFLFSFCSQFYPRTTRLNSIPQVTCGLSISTITITPTIPARQNVDKDWPKISFWLPFEIQLVDKSQCDTELRGTQSITLRIKATCPAAGASEGLKAIIPKITNIRHSSLWNPSVGLPTIWVCTQITIVMYNTCFCFCFFFLFKTLRYSF